MSKVISKFFLLEAELIIYVFDLSFQNMTIVLSLWKEVFVIIAYIENIQDVSNCS